MHASPDDVRPHEADEMPDMLPAVLIGALLSAAVTLPMALPFQATAARPRSARPAGRGAAGHPVPAGGARGGTVLPAAEMSLLGLLEVLLGVLWAWLWAGENPGASALTGGALVIGALAGNEALAMLRKRSAAPT